jgi:hypothetical protein
MITKGDMNRWWGYFKNSKYVDLINTSGGGHLANNPKIDPHNPVTYDFMRKLTGRRIIGDCGLFDLDYSKFYLHIHLLI